MATPGWLNENEYRDWPFVNVPAPATDPLPPAFIVDFGAIMAVDSGFDSAEHTISLYAIRRLGTTFTFEFRVNMGDAAAEACVFTRELGAEEFLTEWVDAGAPLPDSSSSAGLVSSGSSNCARASKWQAYLVTGDLAGLAAFLPDDDGDIKHFHSWQIEPSRIQSLANAYLSSINLANAPRTRAEAPDECEPLPPGDDSMIVAATCIVGDVSFEEGFNVTIRQEDLNNKIIFSAGVGAGAGEPCEEIPLSPTEAPLPGEHFLSGGPRCRDVLKTINGVGGSRLVLLAGRGVRVVPDPDDAHALVVSMDLEDLTTCPAVDLDSDGSSEAGGSL